MTGFRKLCRTALLAASTAALAAPAAAENVEIATAQLALADGTPAGTATLRDWPAGVLIELQLVGLTPGEHAFHIHQTGACQPDFAAAGDHFAPEGKAHGLSKEDGAHAGDMPNIFVDVEGAAVAHVLNTRVTLDEAAAALLDDDGAALIVHAGADTYGADAGAGERVACGVIEPGL